MHRLAALPAAVAGIFTLVAAASVILPKPVEAESLRTALSDAYRDNPTLKAARAQLRATNERVPQALSNWRPQVSLNGSVGRQKVEDESQFNQIETTTTPRDVTFQVQQPVYRGGQTVAGTDRAEFEVKSERNRVLNTQQDVLQRAVEAYMNVWRDREILRLNKENVRSLQDQLDAAKERFQRGVATRTDVAQARTRLARAKARRETTQGQLTNSMAVYEEVIGHPPGELTYPDNMAKLPANIDAAVSRAAENNPQVRAARFSSRAADREVRQRTGQLLPTVTLTGEVARREQQLRDTDETQTAEVRLGVQVPLYQSGQVTSQVRQAKQTASQRRLQVAEAKRRARQQARSAWGRLRAARRQINQRRTQVEAAEVAVTGAEEELKVGSRTVFDVLDAEQDLFNAQISLVRARRDIAVARFNVLQAVGDLTARSLDLDVKLYDAEADYDAVRGLWWGLGAPGDNVGETYTDADTGSSEQADSDAAEATASEASATMDGGGTNDPADADMADGGSTSADADEAAAANGEAEMSSDTDSNETTSGGRNASGGDGTGSTTGATERATSEADAAEQAEDERARTDTEGADTQDAQTARAPSNGEIGPQAVEEIEQLLSKLDFAPGKIDGKIDPKTRAAIGRFQQAAGLPVTYRATKELLAELREVAGNVN